MVSVSGLPAGPLDRQTAPPDRSPQLTCRAGNIIIMLTIVAQATGSGVLRCEEPLGGVWPQVLPLGRQKLILWRIVSLAERVDLHSPRQG